MDSKQVIRALIALVIVLGVCFAAGRTMTSPTDWNDNVTTDIDYADGSSAHFDNGSFGLVSVGDTVKVHVALPEDQKIDNAALCFYLYHSIIDISYDGQSLYSYGEDIYKSGQMIGGVWPRVVIPDEAWGDTIEIECYVTEPDAFAKISNVQLLPADEALRYPFENNYLSLFISVAGLLLAAAAFLVLIIMGQRGGSTRKAVAIIVFGAFMSLWTYAQSGSYLLFSDSYIWQQIDFLALYFLPMPMLLYIYDSEEDPNFNRITLFVSVLYIAFVVICTLLNFLTPVHFCRTLVYMHGFAVFIGLLMLWFSIRRVRSRSASGRLLLQGIILLLIIVLVDLARFNLTKFMPTLSGFNTSTLLPVGMLLFFLFLVMSFYTDIDVARGKEFELELEIQRLEQELQQTRIRSIINQLQPHFLYNSLSAIKTIVRTDPDYAHELLGDFTTHLHASIQAIASDDPIAFVSEVENIKSYLNIEKMRFGDKLKIDIDIKATNFDVLPLSIQPLVENAVRNGIYPRGKAGGTVVLKSFEEGDTYVVEVEDDGVGFDTKILDGESEKSFGLRNLRFRIDALMHATLSIESKDGEGTKVRVTIPKSFGIDETEPAIVSLNDYPGI